jgi:hypothetical protein
VGYVGQKALFGEETASLARFLLTRRGEIDVPPSCEAVLEVPQALAVTDEYKW